MACVQVCSVAVLDNPASFLDKYKFEVTFECLKDIKEDLEWKVIYVGSAENPEKDQVLDSVLVGPVSKGVHRFVYEVDPPDTSKLPIEDVVGITVILLTCSYREQEFVRIGYFVRVEYKDEALNEEQPKDPMFEHLVRTIITEDVRVNKFKINWNDEDEVTQKVPFALNGNENLCNGGPTPMDYDDMMHEKMPPPPAPEPKLVAMNENSNNI